MKVAGKGIEKIKNAGCTVITAVLEEKCREKPQAIFNFSREKKRPYIVFKMAETKDGFIGHHYKKRSLPKSLFGFTNDYSKQLVHKLAYRGTINLVRNANDCLETNPKLDARLWKQVKTNTDCT